MSNYGYTNKFIVVFHGTNLSEVELKNVRKEGLKRSSTDLLIKKAKHRFVGNKSKSVINEIELEIDEYFQLTHLN